ncbi:MAG: pilus assembly protein PilM [Deltaproteobacteria bacterium]|nr:pilus assembly protein PilM [Deltaproteobacteria bacterium]
MLKKTLGLDISNDAITAVQIKGDLKGYQVTGCDRVEIEGDGGFDDALKVILDRMDLDNFTCLTAIAGEHVSYRNLQVPFKDKKKIGQVLPFEIETMVPFPVESMVIDFAVWERSDHSEILAAYVKKTFISQHLARLKSHGIDPEILDIRCVPVVSRLLRQEGIPDNGLFIEINDKKATMVLYLKRRVALIRTFDLKGVSVSRSILGLENDENSGARTFGEFEPCLLSLCSMVENTIHAFGSQKKRLVRPEKFFFTGAGAL